MPNTGPGRAVRPAAEHLAREWLQTHGWCDCAIQIQTVATRLVPVVAMFEHEIGRNRPEDWGQMQWRIGIYYKLADRELARGLHRPGASAALADDRRGTNGVVPHS